MDLVPDPYDSEADWTGVADWTARAADAGLGVTVHVGEFAQANIAQAIALPGVSRLRHAVFAATDARLLDARRAQQRHPRVLLALPAPRARPH
jgi:adenosine deaminase